MQSQHLAGGVAPPLVEVPFVTSHRAGATTVCEYGAFKICLLLTGTTGFDYKSAVSYLEPTGEYSESLDDKSKKSRKRSKPRQIVINT